MRSVGILVILIWGLVALAATLSRVSMAQSSRYMAAPDAPGSVWRINIDTGELEHCSLIKSGCDVVDRND